MGNQVLAITSTYVYLFSISHLAHSAAPKNGWALFEPGRTAVIPSEIYNVRLHIPASHPREFLEKFLKQNAATLELPKFQKPEIRATLTSVHKQIKLETDALAFLTDQFEHFFKPKSSTDARFLGALVSFLSVGTSLYALHEVEELRSQVHASRQLILHNHALLRTLAEQTQQAFRSTDLKEAVQTYGNLAAATVRQHSDQMREIVQALEALKWNQLHNSLARAGHLDHAKVILQKRAQAKNLRLLHDGFASHQPHPISYGFARDGVDIFVHILAVKSELTSLRIHHFRHAVVAANHSLVLLNDPRYEAILVDSKGLRHIPLTAADLTRCVQSHDVLICRHIKSLRLVPDSCLADLFFETQQATDTCIISQHAPSSALEHLGDNHFLIMTSSAFSLICPGAESKRMPPSPSPTVLKLSQGCQIVGPEFEAWVPLESTIKESGTFNFHFSLPLPNEEIRQPAFNVSALLADDQAWWSQWASELANPGHYWQIFFALGVGLIFLAVGFLLWHCRQRMVRRIIKRTESQLAVQWSADPKVLAPLSRRASLRRSTRSLRPAPPLVDDYHVEEDLPPEDYIVMHDFSQH